MKSTGIKNMLLVALIGLALTACKKADVDTATGDVTTTSDQSNVSQHMNATMDDVAGAAGSAKLSGKTESQRINLCNVIIDSSHVDSGLITLTYNGLGCEGVFNRTGIVTIQLVDYAKGKHWKDVGAILNVTMTNLKLTNTNTAVSHTFNGTHTITNLTGGLSWKIVQGISNGTVSYRHTSSDMQITFDDGTKRSWSVDRTRTFSNATGKTIITLNSTNTVDGHTGVEAWGTNRNGIAFYGIIASPISVTNLSGCDPYFGKPYTGEHTHLVGTRSLDILYGVNASGIPNGTSSTCPYGYKITYTKLGVSQSKVVEYRH
jgi:hypothetical protein